MPEQVEAGGRDPVMGSVDQQDALAFFRTVRQRPDLRERLSAWDPATTTERLLELAREVGLACSADELHEAFRLGWVMRWLHDGRGGGSDERRAG